MNLRRGEERRFEGRTALITGGTKGIGRACAVGLAAEGARVIVNYAHSERCAEQAVRQIVAGGGMADRRRADIGSPEEVRRMWESLRSSSLEPDILVLNAAFQRKATVDETDRTLLLDTFAVNVFGNYDLARMFAESCRRRKTPGVIVVHSSNQSEFVYPTSFAYALTKSALNHMVRHLARAWADDNIRVNGVILGWFDTEGEREFYTKEQIAEQAARTIPMRRPGIPEEAARMTLFLASREAAYVTGSLLRVDGGFALAPDLTT